jgi:SAM-dependent methyltransferase
MKEFWDERYAAKEYVYGREPNEFLRSRLDKLSPGRMLLPGEGEGRNAVYAASRGWDVLAFDQSETGKAKALQLAKEKGVAIDYRTGSLLDIKIEPGTIDLVGLVYFHLLPEVRTKYHAYLANILAQGGMIIMEVFSKKQINNESGGPKDLQLLYSLDDILQDFDGLEVLYASEESVHLDEGPFHQGMAEVIRLAAQKA